MKTTYLTNPIRDDLKPHSFRAADADCQQLRKSNQAQGALKPILKTTAWMLALTCSNAMAQNLVSNPGFETGTPSTGYPAGSIDLPGWTVNTTPSDGVQLYLANILGATQTPDTLVLQLTGTPNYVDGGGVQQSIATTSGVTYTITIDVASRGGNSLTGNFSFGGQNQTLSASSQTFETRTWTVIATSASTLIDITGSTSSGSSQLLIDNVTVTPPPQPINWGTPTTITSDTDVSTTGTFKYAYHWASGDQTVNGVTFTGTTSFTDGGSDVGFVGFAGQFDTFVGTTTPFTGLSAAYQATLAGSPAIFTGDVINATVTLKNLTPGNEYAVQVWSQDARDGGGSLFSTTLTSPGGNSVVLDYNSTDADGGVGQYSIGTFIASATTQTFTTSSTYPLLNALQVRDITAGGTPYEIWAADFLPANVSNPAGDNDGDGLTNFQEYAFGLSPISGSSVNPISVRLNKTAKTFSYIRRDTTKTDLNYSVWFSTNLSTWIEDTGATEGTPVLAGEVETVQVTLSSLPGNPLPPSLFIQVRAN